MSTGAASPEPAPLALQAGATDAGERLDVWLCRQLPSHSRARIQDWIRSGCVQAIGRSGLRPNTRVTAGLEVRVTVPPVEESPLRPEPIPLNVLYEDADVIVVDKQAGLVVHPAAGHASGTLVHALLHRCGDLAGIGGERRPGIVHRLDKDTSGAMVAAKNEPALDGLARQFKRGAVRKVYLALVHGNPRPAAGRIETLIGRSRADRKRMSARPAHGRPAVTHYEVLESWGAASLLRVRIETGRTHQIRVHMAHIGHPVLGDRQYGGRRARPTAGVAAPRQMLHAHELTFTHPRTRQSMTFTAPLPADMAALLDALRSAE